MARQVLKKISKLILLTTLSLVAALGASRMFLGPVFIPSGSMLPALQPGDAALVNRLAYGIGVAWGEHTVFQWASPKQGDIVVFKAPSAPQLRYRGYLVKRVVAGAGDTVQVRRNRLSINGHQATYASCTQPASPQAQCDETLQGTTHLARLGLAKSPDFGPVTVPAGHVFVMGDNRDNSQDSRVGGAVDEALIEGKVLGRVSLRGLRSGSL
jgi:signal peptidase I